MDKVIITATLIIVGTLAFIYAIARGLGNVTNIDDPLDDKFWKDKV